MTRRNWRKILLSSKKQHEFECSQLRNMNFKSINDKNKMLRYYCDEVFTKDIQRYIFIGLGDDGYRFPTLERSIERGKKYFWIHDEFIETDSGLLPKWYLENKSNCS